MREFGQGGLEVICSSLRHDPREDRVADRQAALDRLAAEDSASAVPFVS